ncbi:MAG: lectin-like domain-containing protein, partial [Planctomycetaceae bacterium]
MTASIGSASAPVQVTLTPGAALDAFAPGGVFISSDGDLTVDAVAAIPLEISGFMAGTAEWALVNGDSGIEDFTGFVPQGDATLTTVNGVPGLLTLTDGTGYSASAAWAPVAVATAGFTVNFQYQATGLAQADGIAVVFQNAGTSALGGDGGSLGYVGIPGQTVAYEMNLYSKWGVGTNFVTTNSSTQYNSTGAVNIASGNPIAVQLVYDAITQTLTETLTETISAGQTATYQKVYTSIRLPALLGPTATFGFTGGDGALTSIQQVSLLPNQPLFQQTVPQLIGNGLLAIPSTGVGDQISAAWHRTPVSINRDFSTSFVYQAKGVNPADGLALVFQNAGLDALGDLATYGGSSLGYAGLGNNLNTAAYEINIYNDQAPHVVGSNVAVNGAYGSYNTTGDVSFASGHKISVTLDYSASAGELTESLIDLTTGATWQRVYPLDLATTLAAETALIGFTAANGAAFAEQVVTEFQFAYDIESTADVVLTATAGSIVMAGEGSLVRGANVTLEAASSVGAAAPVRVRLDTQTLANGTVLGGVLSGTAGAGFSALVPVGDLRLGTVVAGGTVSLAVPSGNLVDGLTADASSLNRVANPAHRGRIQQLLWQTVTAPTQQTIASYEALIDRDYVQYWSLVSNGSVVAGVFTLNTAALPQFEPQAALYYGVPTASDAQVQSWAALTYVDCVNTFASSLALGPDWASLPEFAEYDPTWEFVAPPATVIALSQGSESVFGVVSAASLVALNSAAVSGGGPGVNLEAGQVVLSAGGTIGLIQEPVVIPLSDISNQTLTAEQRTLLELASVAGALQMVGVSATGETIRYGFSQPPAGVTPTGVQVEFSRPVFTKIATGCTLSASAESVSLTQVVGSLTVDSVVAPGAVRLESQG